MKTKIILTSLLLMFGLMAVQAQNSDMFEKLSNHKDVTTVYISKSLLNMMPNLDTGGADIKSLAGKLEQLEIYNTNGNKEANSLIRKEVEALTKSKTYETLMKIKDGTDNVTFYAHKEKDRFKDLIMFVNEPDDCTIIRIMGNFTAEDIQKVMDSKK